MSNYAQVEEEVYRIVEDRLDPQMAATVTHIARAQRAIEDYCAFDIQKAEVTFQILPVDATYAKPDDFIAVRRRPRYLERTNSAKPRQIEEVDDVETFGNATEEGPPRYWEDYNETSIRFWPRGDDAGPSVVATGAYDVTVPYWKRLGALSDPTDTNWWSENMDDVLAWRAVAFILAEMRDPMANWWSAVAAARFVEIKRQKKRNKMRSRATTLFPKESLSSYTNRDRGLGHRTWVADIG